MEYQDVLNFWFEELPPEKWWSKDPDLDGQIRDRFGEMRESAVKGEMHAWRKTAEGRLAEIILLDQFSRNIFRDQPESFHADGQALVLAQHAVELGEDKKLAPKRRAFLYMPFMHSESPLIHQTALKLFASHPDLSGSLEFEKRHKAIIDRFGRYPHRNSILGRLSTPEEEAFLREEGSSF